MFVFVLNPLSGNGKSLKTWLQIEAKLQAQNIEHKILHSTSEVETTAYLEKAKRTNSIRAVVVIGGDGTISSVIQSFANTNTPIAIFPTGSGNDTARMFQLTNDPERFLEALFAYQITTIDLLKVNERFGITIAGVGIDAMIGHRVNQAFYKPILSKLRMGPLAYLIAATLSVLSFQSFNGEMTIDNEKITIRNGWLIACGNTASYGGGLAICPQASPTDGLLNITLFHKLKRFRAIKRIVPALLGGKEIFKEGVTYKEGTRLTIQTDRALPTIVDGEITRTTPLQITIHKKALHLLLTT